MSSAHSRTAVEQDPSVGPHFLFVSLVTNRVSPEEVCLPIFDVLTMTPSCLDDEIDLPLKVSASFSASRFTLP